MVTCKMSVMTMLLVQVAVAAVLWQGVSAYDPCCSFPCQNGGVCTREIKTDSYSCDCENLEFYGKNCETPFFWKRIRMAIKPGPAALHAFLVSDYTRPLFSVINNVQWISDAVMKKVYLIRSNIVDTPPLYETFHGYPTIAATTNNSFYVRSLPPVPLDCPTEIGVKGPVKLPDPDLLIEKFFRRKSHRPDPRGSSLLFAFFAQHFTHMYFKTDLKHGPGYTWGGYGIDATSYYGPTVKEELHLRSHKDGKLKMQVINGETYPVYLKDAPVEMTYPPHVKEESKFAMGHRFFGLLPGLFLYQIMWMREHNRVCDVLKEDHPEWDDERLFQTAKLILIGETIKIVIEDYVEHLADYNLRLKFRPSALFGESYSYQNRINVEFNLIYHWHPLIPDSFNISGVQHDVKDVLFRPDLVVKHGAAAFTDSLGRQRAGQMSHHNHGEGTIHVLREQIKQGRELRLQSLNNYRKRFNMPAYKDFEDLTGEKETARELQKVYKDIDAVELTTGTFFEKRRERALFGETVVEMGGPYSIKGLMSNPICSPLYWKPSTFGGQRGFDMVNTASLKKLFCNNIKGPCPWVAMTVPDFVAGDVTDEHLNFKQEIVPHA